MLAFLELALSNLRQGVYSPLKDVLLLEVTVIIDEDFKQMLCVLTELIKDVKD